MSLFDKINLPPSEYKVHTFTSTGTSTFAVTGSGDVEYLVVAGGGGGGGAKFNYGGAGGGGGAGGFKTATGFGVTSQSYTVTVGTGGSGAVANGAGSNGSDSSFSTIISTGGGYGGSGSGAVAGDGGSGGGGSGTGSTDNGTGISGQGFNGALGGSGGYSASGGGGSSAVGIRTAVIGGDADGGAGGAGTASSIQTGNTITYAGGGGGGGYNTNGGGAGGSGGGGTGGIASSTTAPTVGTANLGGGGGGALSKSSASNGANGGSGIVIIRYKTSSGITATGGTISSTVTGLANQRVVENFSGSVVDTDRWTNTGFGAGAGNTTFTIDDQVDGGALMLVSSGTSGEGIANFNDIRQFSPTGSVFICVTKSNDVASGQNSRVGLKWGSDVTFNGGQLVGTENGYNVTSISSFCSDNSGYNRTNTSLSRDSLWHTFKGQLTSSDYKLAVDGVMETTDTTNLPTVRLQPFLYKAFNSGYTSSSSTRYYEAYNT